MTHAAAAVVLALLAQPAAANFDVPALMRLLGAVQEVKVAYVERKYSPILVAPVESSGLLVYRRFDAVEKVVLKPRPQRIRILRDEVIVERNGREQHLSFASTPALAGLAASIRGVLSGDTRLLEERFELRLSGDEAAWTLELTPRDDALRVRLQGVTLSGHLDRVAKIETFEASGERTVMEIR